MHARIIVLNLAQFCLCKFVYVHTSNGVKVPIGELLRETSPQVGSPTGAQIVAQFQPYWGPRWSCGGPTQGPTVACFDPYMIVNIISSPLVAQLQPKWLAQLGPDWNLLTKLIRPHVGSPIGAQAVAQCGPSWGPIGCVCWVCYNIKNCDIK